MFLTLYLFSSTVTILSLIFYYDFNSTCVRVSLREMFNKESKLLVTVLTVVISLLEVFTPVLNSVVAFVFLSDIAKVIVRMKL